jgi:hypothetical protein
MFPMLKNAKLQYEASTQMQAEAEALRLIALAGGAHLGLKMAEARRSSPRVLAVLKAAAPRYKAAAPGVTTVSGADVVGPTVSAFTALEAALRTSSVYDAVASEAMEAAFHVRVGMMTGQMSGAKTAEGAAKLAQVMTFAANALAPEKFVSVIACTQEFLDAMPGAMESLTTQLRVAVGSAADLEFLADIAATNSDASSGLGTSSLSDIMADIIGQLLPMVDYAQASRLWLVVSPDQARAMTMAAYAAGIVGMTPLGGTFAGLRTIVSDSLPSATISIIDATGLVMASTPITVRTSSETALELATSSSMTSATGTGASVVSMFQTNSIALLAERSIAFAPLRPNSFASLTSVQWGAGSMDSPLP